MLDRELIVGVLGVQAGFVSPAQVMVAASARLMEPAGPGLLDHLQRAGALTPARRALLDAMADEALAAARGDSQRALERLGGEEAVLRTLGDTAPPGPAPRPAVADVDRRVPDERPGQYTRLDELGRGGQSVVRRALDEFIGREVAIKELRDEPLVKTPSDASAARARFLREARLTAQLDHRGIVAVHELARRPDGALICVQKLIRGETLRARLARCESLEQRLALLPHVLDACQALAYAHSRGVIHRDLKPANIMIGPFGETVVVDWGLAKRRGEPEPAPSAEDRTPPEPGLTLDGVALGTPAYMSPEQARGDGDRVDERSDVFSMGVILYEVLTARLPFEGADHEQTLDKVIAGRFPPVLRICPQAPPELAAVAERAIRPDPEARYPGAEPLAKELLAYRAGARVTAYEYRSWELVKRFVARNRALSAVSGAALVILLASSIAIGQQLRLARLSLANSFLERARAAALGSDWARAAGYYAASRIERDSREGRWGYALTHDKMPRRVIASEGKPGSFASVGYLPDGRGLVLALDPPWVIGRELESGRELWRFEHPEPLIHRNVVSGGQVRLSANRTITYLDGATGAVLASLSPSDPRPCGSASVPPHALLVSGSDGGTRLDRVDAAGSRSLLQAGLGGRVWTTVCESSRDGSRVAILDASGVVHLWDVDRGQELASRPAPDAAALQHTAYGVAIVRSHSVQLFGGVDGDFVIGLPGRRGNGHFPTRVDVVSPDGKLLVVARSESNQADVIDLQLRRVVASLGFAPGLPAFAVSPAGDRLAVAAVASGTLLTAWDLRRPQASSPIAGASRMDVSLSGDGRRIMVLQVGETKRAAVYEITGRLLRSVEAGASVAAAAALSADGRRLAASGDAGVTVLEVDSGRELARFDCRDCERVELSGSGGRLAANNGDEVVLWDVDERRELWRERARAGGLAEPLRLSYDGRRLLWAREGTLYLRLEGEASERALPLGEVLRDADFSYDGARVAVVARNSIGVWEVDGLRPVFRIPNTSWVAQQIAWSRDDSALLNLRDTLGTLLIDTRTGQPFANLEVERPATFGTSELASPTLDRRVSIGDGSLTVLPLPAPDESPPARALATVMEETGLSMRGVELTYAPGPP